MTSTCQKRLKRLKAIVSLHEEKREVLLQVRAMREWVMRLEHILDGSWAQSPEEISNAEVARRFDEWLKDLSRFLQAEERTPLVTEIAVLPPVPPESGASRSMPQIEMGYFITNAARMR